MADPTDKTVYKVVVNHEEQYLVLPVSKSDPAGYKPTTMTGTKDECLSYVKKVWKDVSNEDWKTLLRKIK